MNEWETKKQISLRRSGTRGKVKGKRKVSKVKRDMKISMTKKRVETWEFGLYGLLFALNMDQY